MTLQRRSKKSCKPLPNVWLVELRRQDGFTLVELMVTIAIMAILVAIAVPNLRRFLVQSGLESTALDLRGAVSRARGEAIARGTFVTFGQRTGSDWIGGYQLFVDPLQKTIFNAADVVGTGTDAKQAIQIEVGDFPQNASLSWPAKTSNGTSDSTTYFMFDSTGRPLSSTGAFANASLPVCVPSEYLATNNCREVIVNTLGRIRINAFTKSI